MMEHELNKGFCLPNNIKAIAFLSSYTYASKKQSRYKSFTPRGAVQ